APTTAGPGRGLGRPAGRRPRPGAGWGRRLPLDHATPPGHLGPAPTCPAPLRGRLSPPPPRRNPRPRRADPCRRPRGRQGRVGTGAGGPVRPPARPAHHRASAPPAVTHGRCPP